MSITAWAVSGGVLGSPAHLSACRVPERKVPVKAASSSFQPTCSITGTEPVLSKPTTWAQLHLQEPWGAGVHHPLFSDEQTETQKGAITGHAAGQWPHQASQIHTDEGSVSMSSYPWSTSRHACTHHLTEDTVLGSPSRHF